MGLLLAIAFAFATMTASPNNRDAHEAYERWKERHGRVDKEE